MIGNSTPRISKEPSFVGPDEIPMLPKYLVDQDPEQAGGYHLLLKEWWESVYENLNRLRQMVVSYQVAEAKEVADGDLTQAKSLLSAQSLSLVDNLDSSLKSVITQLDQSLTSALNAHKGKTDNPHEVTATQVSLGNVENIALSTWAGSSAITTLGTISSGAVPASKTSGFHAVATSGDYGQLNNLPTLPVFSFDSETNTLTITS